MSENGKNAPENAGGADPDDAPELDDAFFERAEIRDGGVLIKEGKPPIGWPGNGEANNAPAARSQAGKNKS